MKLLVIISLIISVQNVSSEGSKFSIDAIIQAFVDKKIEAVENVIETIWDMGGHTNYIINIDDVVKDGDAIIDNYVYSENSDESDESDSSEESVESSGSGFGKFADISIDSENDYDTGSGADNNYELDSDYHYNHGILSDSKKYFVDEITISMKSVCSKEYIDACAASLQMGKTFSDKMQTLCLNHYEIKTCLRNIFKNCVRSKLESKRELILEEFEAMLDPFCEYQDSEENEPSSKSPLDCLRQENILEKTPKCIESVEKEMKEIFGDSMNDIVAELNIHDIDCIAVHFLIECFIETATDACGANAGKVLEQSLQFKLETHEMFKLSEYC